MDSGTSCGGIRPMLVVQNVSLAVLAKLKQQQEREGQAMARMIEAGAPAPQRGAPEPGKGQLVDKTA